MTHSFLDLGVPPDLAAALARDGVVAPFPVQAATLPDALEGRDLCARAPTGSGKTLAFAIPLAVRATKAAPRRPTGLVLAPTRELAEQIDRVLSPLLRLRQLRSLAVYGGVGLEPQRSSLAKGVDVLVACPGRLEDLLSQKALTLGAVNFVVIDEADRMADMGFLPAVRRLLDLTATPRQTLLFSATLDGDVAVLTRHYQVNPARHEVGPAEADVSAMRHHFWQVERNARADGAAQVVASAGPTIVFCRTRHGADRVTKRLKKVGILASAIHGGRNQGQRDRALQSFAKGQSQALVATDVAARGIHVDGVACVLHFDLPEDGKAYLHRSGRTARAGAEGLVVSFIEHGELRDCRQLQRELGLSVEVTPPDYAGLDGPGHRTPVVLLPEAEAAAVRGYDAASRPPRAPRGPRHEREHGQDRGEDQGKSRHGGGPRHARSEGGFARGSKGPGPRKGFGARKGQGARKGPGGSKGPGGFKGARQGQAKGHGPSSKPGQGGHGAKRAGHAPRGIGNLGRRSTGR